MPSIPAAVQGVYINTGAVQGAHIQHSGVCPSFLVMGERYWKSTESFIEKLMKVDFDAGRLS